jgi:adenine deaminase
MNRLDLLIYNARIVDIFRLRVFAGWLSIRDGRFIHVEPGDPPARISVTETIDLQGTLLVPGLIDSHMHIESSQITPRRFSEAVIPFGTTTILADPHEVGNVAGENGVRWMIAAARGLPLRIYQAIPSCVPATAPEIEWTAEVFNEGVITRLTADPSVIALGEVMDYRGLLGDSPRLQRIVAAAHAAGIFVEGHIPTLSGMELSEYLWHGVGSDHTLATPAKIEEQISKGLAVMLQTKSITAENVQTVMNLPDRTRILLVTDDIEPPLLVKGHLSRMVQMAIKAGMPPLEAMASATIRPARYLGLRHLGAIAPGFYADFMVMSGFDQFPPQQVFVGGKVMARDGVMSAFTAPDLPEEPYYFGVPGPLKRQDFRLVGDPDGAKTISANAVVLQNNTNSLTRLESVRVQVDESGYAQFQPGDGLALLGIYARNNSTASVGIFKNTGFTSGAFASTVCHDSHNLVVIGRDVDSMRLAAETVHQMGGGIAVMEGDQVLARLALPHFGLLSDAPVPEVAADMEAVENALRHLGMTHQRPFLLLSVMGLSVSPYVKFTDKGVVDTERRAILPPWEPVAP